VGGAAAAEKLDLTPREEALAVLTAASAKIINWTPEAPVTFEVEVLTRTDLGMSCQIDGHRVFVGCAVWLSGTTIGFVGDRGRLVLPRWFVQAQGLKIS